MEVNNLQAGYGDCPVLQQINFSVAAGEWVSIIGPNGSGKTTLLRLIGAYLTPSGGTVMVDGRRVETYARKDLARAIAVTGAQIPADFPFTVSEFVLLGRTPHMANWAWERPQDWRETAAAIQQTGLAKHSSQLVNQLSSGGQQKAVLARALAQQPTILLLDEPTVHLDIAGQVELMDLLLRLRDECDLTIIAVLHDLNLAALYSDRLLLVNEGRVQALGSPSEVLTTANIERAYGCKVLITEHPAYKVPQIVPLPAKPV